MCRPSPRHRARCLIAAGPFETLSVPASVTSILRGTPSCIPGTHGQNRPTGSTTARNGTVGSRIRSPHARADLADHPAVRRLSGLPCRLEVPGLHKDSFGLDADVLRRTTSRHQRKRPTNRHPEITKSTQKLTSPETLCRLPPRSTNPPHPKRPADPLGNQPPHKPTHPQRFTDGHSTSWRDRSAMLTRNAVLPAGRQRSGCLLLAIGRGRAGAEYRWVSRDAAARMRA